MLHPPWSGPYGQSDFAYGLYENRGHFYQRVFGFLITVDNPDTVNDVVKWILTLLNNKYENDAYVLEAKQKLKRLADSHNVDMSESGEHLPVDETQDDEVKKSAIELLFGVGSKIRTWIETMAQFVEKHYVNEFLNSSTRDATSSGLDNSSSHLIDNIHYAPHLQQPFIDFLVKIPLFSNIMNRSYRSKIVVATWGATEVSFNVIENHIFHQKFGTRVDKIVEKHLEYIEGNLKPF